MTSLVLAAFFLPTLVLASPTPAHLSTRQDAACTPTSYTISNFTYSTGPSLAPVHVHFNFQSSFSDPSIITDPASAGATCDADGATEDSFPNESECSTGRSNLLWDLRAPVEQADFQIVHTWACNGQTWMSSTPHKIQPLNCNASPGGIEVCTSETQSFAPENVRQICSTPTCP